MGNVELRRGAVTPGRQGDVRRATNLEVPASTYSLAIAPLVSGFRCA